MSKDWVNSLRDRLNVAAHPDGGWGYSPGAAPCAEPTALACLALSARGIELDVVHKGLALLALLQRPDGSVSVALNIKSPCWPTGLAVLAWTYSDSIADVRPNASRSLAPSLKGDGAARRWCCCRQPAEKIECPEWHKDKPRAVVHERGSRSTRGGLGPIGASPDASGRQTKGGWSC